MMRTSALHPAASERLPQRPPAIEAPPHAATPPVPTGPARWRELGAALFIAAVILPNVAPLVVPYELFPFTSAPMFAHYVGPETPRYRMHLVAEFADGRPDRAIRAADLGVDPVPFGRYLFGTVYGSLDPRSPFGHHPDETPATFEARLGDFFRQAATVLARRDSTAWRRLGRIRLVVTRLDDDNRDAETHVVGHYDLATRRFTHTWRGSP